MDKKAEYIQLSVEDLKSNKVLMQIWDLVCKAHAGQTRKGLDKKSEHPEYVTHPFRAMEIIANALGNPKEALKDKRYTPMLAAALAHDAIEDTELNTKEKLAEALLPIMGEDDANKTAFLVQELSNPPEGFKGETKEEKDANKRKWQTEHAEKMSMEAKMVKMADQIANTIDCVDVFMLKQNEKGEWEPLWTTEKKISYVEKAAAVCDSCMVGTQKATLEGQAVFQKLLAYENQAYNYAYLKIENPILCSREFFNELDGSRKVPTLNAAYLHKPLKSR